MKKCKIRVEESLCMIVQLIAKNGEKACAVIEQQYKREELVLMGDHFTGVKFEVLEEEEYEQNRIRRKYTKRKMASITKKRHRGFRCRSHLRNQQI